MTDPSAENPGVLLLAVEKPSRYTGGEVNTVRKVFGDAPRFEYRAGRSFVRSAAIEAVSRELRDAFRRDSLAYLSRSDFPRRFAFSKYREIETNPYRYREFLKEN
jgi:hypothetical protein